MGGLAQASHPGQCLLQTKHQTERIDVEPRLQEEVSDVRMSESPESEYDKLLDLLWNGGYLLGPDKEDLQVWTDSLPRACRLCRGIKTFQRSLALQKTHGADNKYQQNQDEIDWLR